MKIRITSDIHMEHWGHGGREKHKKWRRIIDKLILPPMPDDEYTVLILAGDISDCSCFDRLELLLDIVSERFRAVIYVQGNHEYYDGDWEMSQEEYKRILDKYNNVHWEITVDIEEYRFINTCMWTSMDNGNPIVVADAHGLMNDYKYIMRNPETKLTPYDVMKEHNIAFKQIETCLHNLPKDKKAIVVTHHAPTLLSVAREFKGSVLNPMFYEKNCERLLNKYEPMMWIHGHMHNNSDYEIYNTRVIANPYGYHVSYMNKEYDKNLIINLKEEGEEKNA